MSNIPKYLLFINISISFELNGQGGLVTLSQTIYQTIASLFQGPNRKLYNWEKVFEQPDTVKKMTKAECHQNVSAKDYFLHTIPQGVQIAIDFESFDYVEALLERYSNKISEDAYWLGLQQAARKKHLDLFRLIIRYASDKIDVDHPTRRQPLVCTAFNTSIDFVITTLSMFKQNSISLNTPTEPVYTILWDLENKKFLKPFENGAKREHSLALHAAVDMNRKNIALYLLQCGADPLQEDHEKDTALTIITRRAAANHEFRHLELLLQLYVNYRKKVADTGSHHLGHPIIFTLCPALVSIYNKDGRGNTLLHAVIEAGDWQLAQQLLEIEPLLFHERNNAGYTPLMLSVAHQNAMLRKLITFATNRSKTTSQVNQTLLV